MVKSLKREEPGKEEKEPGKFAKMKKTLSEGIRKCGKGAAGGVAVLAALGMLAGCGDTKDYIPNIPDGQTDGDVDGSVNTDKDLDAGVDGDVDIDGSVDAGVDAGPDVDVDGGQTDGEVDSGDEVSTTCTGVSDETVEEVLFPRGEDVLVGGYHIRYVGAVGPSRVTVDIRCAETGADVATDQRLGVGSETVIEIPEDGKKLRITIQSQNAWDILCSVAVEDL